MTPDEEKRLQKIEKQWSPETTTDVNPLLMATIAFEYDIPWLIARYREADAHLHGKGGEAE